MRTPGQLTTLSEQNLKILRNTLNEAKNNPEFCAENAEKLDASDIAFFAFAASLDGKVDDGFHPAFAAFRHNSNDHDLRARIIMRLRRAVFDHAALLDHITGGTTLVVHMPGAMEPNTPAAPEYVKAHVYVPRTIIHELEMDGGINTVPDIVQLLVRELGVPTLERFERIRKRVYPNSRRPSRSYVPRPLPEVGGMPMAIPEGSDRYLFYGRKFYPSDELYGVAGDERMSEEGNAMSKATRASETTRATTPGRGGS